MNLNVAALAVVIAASTALAQSSATQPTTDRPATQPIDAGPAVKMPYSIERFTREGPMAGVVVKLDLTDPRVHVVVKLADARDPDGDGPAVGRLDTVVHAAEKNELELAMNASYFAVIGSQTKLGKKVGYYVGNGAYPVGWLYSEGKTFGTPQKPALEACVIVHNDGHVTIEENVKQLPADVKYAVSGNAKVLKNGEVTGSPAEPRHPRSAVGVSADGKTLVIMAIDGRRPGFSRGVTLAEEGALLKEFGASDGLNLDGGGSTALVVKDAVTGVYGIVNRPSETFSLAPAADSFQRPVVDVLGVQIDDE